MPTFLPMPAYSIGAPLDTSEITNALTGFGNALEKRRELDQNKLIGNRLATGDYAGGAAKAFELGKLDTGLGIKKFATAEATAEEERHHKIIQRMAGAAQSALEEKDPTRQAAMFKGFMGIPGVMDALPPAYKTDPKAALGYIVNSAREVGDELKMRYKSQLEQEGRFERGRALGLIPPSGGATPSIGADANPMRAAITKAAVASGGDPATLLTIGKMESDLGRVPTNPRSSASGLYHFLDENKRWATNTGVPYGDTPESQTAAMAAKMQSDAELFRRRTGRDPQPWEHYILHYQGGPLGTQLLTMHPRTPMTAALGPRAGEILRANPNLSRYATVGDFLGDYKRRFEGTYAGFAGRSAMPEVGTAPAAAVTPATAPAAAATAAAVPTDPYLRITQPAISREQEEAERKRRAAIEFYGGDEKAAAKIMAKEEEPKEFQTKDALFAERMARSEITLRGITGPEGKKYNPGQLANKWWFDDSIFNGQNWRSYQASAREWIAGMLRKDTGAAVTPAEWELYFPTYFPQPGDGLDVQKQKLDRRAAAAGGLRASSGPAFGRMYPNFDVEMRQRLADQDPTRYGTDTGSPPDDDIPVLTPEEARRQPPGTLFRTKPDADNPQGRLKRVPGGTPVRGHQ